MEDSEARYLINQFNNYASWSLKYVDVITSFGTFAIAMIAMSIASVVYFGKNWLTDYQIEYYYPVVWSVGILLMICVIVILLIGFMNRDRNEKKLLILEDYRSRNKCLPNDLTLKKIIEFKPNNLEQFLKDKDKLLV